MVIIHNNKVCRPDIGSNMVFQPDIKPHPNLTLFEIFKDLQLVEDNTSESLNSTESEQQMLDTAETTPKSKS